MMSCLLIRDEQAFLGRMGSPGQGLLKKSRQQLKRRTEGQKGRERGREIGLFPPEENVLILWYPEVLGSM